MVPYLEPYTQYIIKRLIRLAVWVLQLNGASVPMCVEAGTNVLDVLREWLPLDAGQGFLRIKMQGTGSLNIIIQDSTITISLVATLPFSLPMEAITVFKLDEKGVVLGDNEKVHFVLLLLRRATWGWSKHNPNVEIEAEWVWTSNLRPSPKWVALRKEAWSEGMQPPRAEHWLADDPQDITGA